MRVATLLLLTALHAPALVAQDAPVPAAIAVHLRNELELDETQVGKLRELASTQGAAYLRIVSLYLRAESEVIDAARGDDPVLRRTSLEKRAKLAIDGEIARLRWDKEVRAVLNARQSVVFGNLAGRGGDRRRAIWQALVDPTVLAVVGAQPADSGEVRIAVTPVHADIYLDGVKIGNGRKFMILPAAKYEIKLHAVGCTEVVLPIEITRGPPVLINQTLTCGK